MNEAHELEAAGFLLTPSQPANHEEAHQGHDDHAGGAELERDLSTDRVQGLGGSVEGDGRGVVLGCRGRLIEGGLGRIKALDARHSQRCQHDDSADPDHDPDAVAAQDEADQCDGADDRGHGRGRGVALRSRSTGSGSFASSSP